jgi:hypothetical protein
MSTFGVPKIRGRTSALWAMANAANALALFLLAAGAAALLVGGRDSLGSSISLLRLGLILAGLVAAALAARGALQAFYPERFAGPGETPWRSRRTWGTVLAIQGIVWSLWCTYTVTRPLSPGWGTYLPGLAVTLTSALWLREIRPPAHVKESRP